MSETGGYSTATAEAREQQIVEHLSLVKKIARSFAARVPGSVDPMDLESAGTIGLIRAVDAFDPKRGVVFEAFASKHIRGSILDHLRAQDPLPYSTRVKIRTIEKGMLALQRKHGRPPTDDELSLQVGMEVNEIGRLMAQASGLTVFSLNEVQDVENATTTGRDEAGPDALSALERQQMAEMLISSIQALPRTERLVLSLYYFERLKMREIGNLLDLTESRVSQIHAKAITMLRAQVREVLEQQA
jgi:RNA polymerase sigma factor for flagellar operon FliA